MTPLAWFAVRCVFRTFGAAGDADTYEERITLWDCSTIDDAIRLAETEAADYAASLDCEYVGLAQAYSLSGGPSHGAEVFSLIRESPLDPSGYLSAFFDTGGERQAAQTD